MTATPFKAYDIRGRVPDELNADLARRIGHAFVATQQARTVLIGLCGTEEVYFGSSTTPTASASNSPTGASTCAAPTPNRSCASTSRPAPTPLFLSSGWPNSPRW